MAAAIKNIPGTVPLWRFLRGLVDPRYRHIRRLLASSDPRVFQPYDDTRHDRYPAFFTFVRDRLADVAAPRILSFGCSTGEEVATLRRYFPNAEITGIDINSRSIKLCRRRLASAPDPSIRFVCANSPAAEPGEHYDAIFCLSVLRHGDLGARPERCDHLIRFVDFEAMVSDLARCLAPGGYFILWNCHFRFCDTAIAKAFEVVMTVSGKARFGDPLFGRDDRLLGDPDQVEAIFRKRPATP